MANDNVKKHNPALDNIQPGVRPEDVGVGLNGIGDYSMNVVVDKDRGKCKIPFINESTNLDPTYESEGASGFDIRASLDSPIILAPLERALIPTGLYFGLPKNIELQIRPRSGLAAKNGVTVLNTPGTVDSDYRGEVKIILVNLSNETFQINHGDRIAQGVYAQSFGSGGYKMMKTDSLDETTRGSGGFGSTGVK